jgi:CheY-like chemotaxis protein
MVRATTKRSESRRPRVLLAEDDVHLRAFLSSVLIDDGYDVVEASDGAELVDHLENHQSKASTERSLRVDLVVTDVRMPGTSGLDVLGEFRRKDRTTPFVLITAFGTEELHAKAKKLGAEAVLDKPFEIDDLRMIVKMLVPPDGSLVSIVPEERAEREEDSARN